MNCRNPKCKAELVPYMVVEFGATEETQWKLNGELVYCCPNGCRCCQHETESWQRLMRTKPKPRIPKTEGAWGRRD